jgi:NAD(P)-dependent dehydrogenase (short-subunit alcohol dehydrogenase family)
MDRSFTGRKQLVVGGTSGMGFETAKAVLERGGSATPSGALIAQRSPTEQSRGNGVEPTWN